MEKSICRYQDHIATSCTSGSNISIWNLHVPHYPVCVLRSHGVDSSGTTFAWIDTPAFQPVGQPGASNTSSSSTSSKYGGVGGTQQTTSTERNITIDDTAKCADVCKIGYYHHILSVNKTGKIILQDIRNGYFIQQHRGYAMSVISAAGAIAHSTGYVNNVRLVVKSVDCFCCILRCVI